MGVVIGQSTVTQFSYIEYQALMLALAGTIVVGFLLIELFTNRFQVLPLVFPGMFSIRERKFFFFDMVVEDVAVGQRLRKHAKNLTRLTLCVVLSYLWEHCVLETEQIVGTAFPTAQCDVGKDCFASKLHFLTLVTREHTSVDCTDPHDFDTQVVVSCIRFVKPTSSVWMMHMAISHSLTLLNFKFYEVLTWIGGTNPWVRRSFVLVGFAAGITFIALFFTGVMSEFVSSWLGFVMSLSIPCYLFLAYQSSMVFVGLQQESTVKMQKVIDEHMQVALQDFAGSESAEALETFSSGRRRQQSWPSCMAKRMASTIMTRARELSRRGKSLGGDEKGGVGDPTQDVTMECGDIGPPSQLVAAIPDAAANHKRW